jgi:hypothetical protein
MTATIQAGSISWDRAKPTTVASVNARPVQKGDLLVAMDGDGSLGKAAFYDDERDATIDSHVARIRIHGSDSVTQALSCWLNSTWGRVQTSSLMTGATGQTQLSPYDLSDVLVPKSVIESANEIASTYSDAIKVFEPLTRRSRRLLCTVASHLSTVLIEEKVLKIDGQNMSNFTNADQLLKQLDVLYPSKRT